VEAEIIVGSLQVHGTVTGRIAVDKMVEILPGGRVEGELYAAAPAVQISEGGVFEGELHMIAAAGDGMRREGAPDAPQDGPPEEQQGP
jgi:cytoskeletal protein CcmA (bactofilin family)